MQRIFRRSSRWLSIVVICITYFFAPLAQASSTKEFITSCTYGTLAGTLVGAASLAFTDKPGDNLNNIARGASIGLYAGILLGAYIVWMVPKDGDSETEENPSDPGEPAAAEPPPEDALLRMPTVFPLISQTGSIEGAGISMRILSF